MGRSGRSRQGDTKIAREVELGIGMQTFVLSRTFQADPGRSGVYIALSAMINATVAYLFVVKWSIPLCLAPAGGAIASIILLVLVSNLTHRKVVLISPKDESILFWFHVLAVALPVCISIAECGFRVDIDYLTPLAWCSQWPSAIALAVAIETSDKQH